MKVIKPLLLIGEDENGEVVAVRVTRIDYSVLFNDETDLAGTGVFDQPTVENEELDKKRAKSVQGVEDVLAKHNKTLT